MNINEYIKKLESIINSKTDPKITVTLDDSSLDQKVSVTSNISQILDTFKTFSINLLDEQVEMLINEYKNLKSKPEEETDYPKKTKVYCTIGFKCGYGDSSVSFYANMKDLEGATLLRVYQNSYNTRGMIDHVAQMHFELDTEVNAGSLADKCIRYLLHHITTASIKSIQVYTSDGEPLLDSNFLRDYAMVTDVEAFRGGTLEDADSCACGANAQCQCTDDKTGTASCIWSVIIQETPETAEYVIQNVIAEPVVHNGRLLFATDTSKYSMDESKIFAWHCRIVS